MAIPQPLVSDAKRGNLVPLIGAGLSIPQGGFSWADMMLSLVEEGGLLLGNELPRKDDVGLDIYKIILTGYGPLVIAQMFSLKRGRKRLIDALMEMVVNIKNPGRAHHLLASMGFKYYLTTNYDDLIGKALADENRQYEVLVEDNEIVFLETGVTKVIKLHGSLVNPFNPGSVIVSKSDYEAYVYKYPNKEILLSYFMATKSILLLGFSASDPDFQFIHEKMRKFLPNEKKKIYFITFDLTSDEEAYWSGYGFYPINLDGQNKTQAIETWLQELQTELI